MKVKSYPPYESCYSGTPQHDENTEMCIGGKHRTANIVKISVDDRGMNSKMAKLLRTDSRYFGPIGQATVRKEVPADWDITSDWGIYDSCQGDSGGPIWVREKHGVFDFHIP